jgi:3-oxoacyl-[acyl-carrier-protein] synthase-3
MDMSKREGKLSTCISGTGSAVPEGVLTNAELERMVDTSDEWITERTGIKTRHIGSAGLATSDLCVQAAERAMEDAGVTAEEIEMLIVATVTPDQILPSTACLVQHKMGLKNALAFDVVAACTGFLYGLSVADHYIRAETHRKILVVGAEMLSTIIDWEDRATCVLFGDGAGAAVFEPCQPPRGVLSTFLRSDGNLWDFLYVPGGGSRYPASERTVNERMHYVKMSGNNVFKHAVRAMEEAAQRALDAAGLTSKDLDFFIPHQANLRIIKATAERIKVPMEKVYVNVDRLGNTSAASVPIALDEINRSGQLKDGRVVEMVAFGGGFTWGAALLRW